MIPQTFMKRVLQLMLCGALGLPVWGCRPSTQSAPRDGQEAEPPTAQDGQRLVETEATAAREHECGLPPDLRARDWPTMLPKLEAGAPSPPPVGGISIVVLPDTQYYVACQNEHLKNQVDYILRELGAQRIELVLTVGDLTDHNDDEEWTFFRNAIEPLVDRVPLILTTGNHDHGDQGSALRRGSGLLRAFGAPPSKSRALLAETPADDNWENAYYRLPLRGGTLGILSLEWSPRRDVVEWARAALDRYPTDRVIFTTHAYLYHDDTRYDWERFGEAQEWNPKAYGTARLDHARASGPGNWDPAGAYDGEMLWRELIATRPSVFLTLNGHVLYDGQGYLASIGQRGQVVHQLLANFQMLAEGGSGFLRLLQIEPGGRTLRVRTYSPSLDRQAMGPEQRFDLPISPPLPL